MKWDQDGIAVCKSIDFAGRWAASDSFLGGFYRVAVPQDVKDGSPNPANWGTPVAMLAPDNCDPLTYFVNHSIIFGTFHPWPFVSFC